MIVASSDLGDLGPKNGEAVVVEWQWYEHLPYFAGWALIVALLVLVRENRNLQAWAIWIPFLLLSEVIWPWIVRLLSLPTLAVDQLGDSLQLLLGVWTALWLLSPWLARRRPSVAFLLALGLAAMVGIIAQLAIHQSLELHPLLIYMPLILALLLAFLLTRHSCRKTYRPGRFLAWLVLWLVVGAGLSMSGLLAWMIFLRSSFPPLSFLLIWLISFSLGMAVVLYFLNLPFMYLAFRCPVYMDRFHKILRLPEPCLQTITSTDDCDEGECK